MRHTSNKIIFFFINNFATNMPHHIIRIITLTLKTLVQALAR